MFWSQVKDGLYVQDDAPVYYVYELVMDGRSQVGLVACASIDDYQNEIIKKHENTRAEKEVDRILMRQLMRKFRKHVQMRLYTIL